MVSTAAEPVPYRQFLVDFEQTVRNATARLNGLSDEQASAKTDDGWSRKETVGHLIDSAANNHQRFVRGQFTDDLVFPGYEGDQWVSAQKYSEASWPDLIQLWSSYNLHLLRVVSSIPADVLTKPREKHSLDQIAFKLVDKNRPATLEYVIRDYVDHLRHHLDQIFAEHSTE